MAEGAKKKKKKKIRVLIRILPHQLEDPTAFPVDRAWCHHMPESVTTHPFAPSWRSPWNGARAVLVAQRLTGLTRPEACQICAQSGQSGSPKSVTKEDDHHWTYFDSDFYFYFPTRAHHIPRIRVPASHQGQCPRSMLVGPSAK
jgi:hypothetical protein